MSLFEQLESRDTMEFFNVTLTPEDSPKVESAKPISFTIKNSDEVLGFI